jgi:hypothetical protein
VAGDVNCTGAFRINGVALVSGVSSVFGRTGAVVAQVGDYTAAQVTNAVSSALTYSDPAWLTSLSWSKIIGAPAFLVNPLTTKGDLITYGTAPARLPVGANGQVLTADNTQALGVAWTTPAAGGVTSWNTRTGAVVPATGDYSASQVTNAVSTLGAYADPAWITSLSYSKIMGAPAPGNQTPWLSDIDAAGYHLRNLGAARITGALSATNAPNTFGLDESAGFGHLVSWGPDAATPGGFIFTAIDSDGTGTAERMRISSKGDVGIGNPAILPVALTGFNWLIVGPSAATGTYGQICACGNNTGGNAIGSFNFINYASASADQRIGGIYCLADGAVNSGALAFYTTSAGAATERMRITSAGLVGIGTASPVQPLEVVGTTYRLPATSGAAQDGTMRVESSGHGEVLDIGVGSGIWLQSRLVSNYATNFNLLLNPNGGNVGIGTTSPTGSVHAARSDGNYQFVLERSGSVTPHIYGLAVTSSGTPTLLISDITAGATRMCITPTGNVGIGTTGPTATLEIDLAGSSGATALYIQNPVATWNTTGLFNSFRFLYTSSAATDGNYKAFHVGAGGVAIGYTATPVYGSSNALYVNGSVGIGTNAPSSQLHIKGIGTSLGGALRIESQANTTLYDLVVGGNNNLYIQSQALGVCIAGNGCVGIGESNPADTLVVTGLLANGYGQIRMVAGNYGCFFRNDGASWYFMVTASGTPYGGWSGVYPITIDLATHTIGLRVGPNTSFGVNVDSINSGGYYLNGAAFSPGISGVTVQNNSATVSGGPFTLLNFFPNGSYQWGVNNQGSGGVQIFVNVVSDVRLKQNVRDLSGGLPFIEQLRPKEFEFNGLGNTIAGQRAVGLIAQELQRFSPASVTSWRSKLHPEDEAETDLLQYDPPEIIMQLVLAVQQLSARIKQLEGRVN